MLFDCKLEIPVIKPKDKTAMIIPVKKPWQLLL
jgi:hypothetical protein